MPGLFIIDLTYVAPLDAVDAHLDEHVRFLERGYAEGLFLVSGPKVPRSGGVIIARAESRETLMAALAQDPFHRHGLAEYAVTEMVPRKWTPDLDALFAPQG
ncbi:YciI family protein [Azospirillum sp.]|uniref:YciI family protein n=1 Tax=Azospirillum sp. TaxID=34012 RepID=UPI002D2A97E1|nr:YciI family protein [Azospirillum sp.]HYD67194.1 YciI family protein [Azospirillum sp.]